MIRLLVVTDTYVGGHAGSERYLLSLVQGLPREEFQIDVVQLTTKTEIPFTSGVLAQAQNVRVLRIPVNRVYGLSGVRAYRICRRLLTTNNYDLVQSVHEKADIINALLPTRGVRPLRVSSRRDEGFKLNARLKMAQRFVNAKMTRIVVPSISTARFLESQPGTSGDKIRIISNGVDLSKFEEMSPERRSLSRTKLGVDHGAFCIGCVANLKPVKGHALLLEAFQKFSSGRSSMHPTLALVGDGELRAELSALAARLGIESSVIFAGRRDNVHELLPAFDVVVSASESEGMSNALLEAAAAGVPVVASDAGGNREVVAHGSSGFLYPIGDAVALADRLGEIASQPNLARAMGERGRRRVQNEFALIDKVMEHADLYRSLIASLRQGQSDSTRERDS